MTEHTPGPWAVGYPDDQTIRADGLRVASVECPRKEWRANARLIAAAPDMLAALHDLAWAISGIEYVETEYAEQVAQARAAIAKAQGEG